jgi:tetratricopeptide (TPR) repeat protein
MATGQPARAVPLHEASYAAAMKQPGTSSIELIRHRSNLGYALLGSGRFDGAAKLHEISVAEAEAKLGPDHLVTLQALSHLGLAYRALGRTDEAITLLQRACDRATIKFGEADANTLVYRLNVLGTRREAGEVAAARAGLEALVNPAEKVFGPTHPTTLAVVQNLADALELQKEWDQALAGRRRVVDAERKRGPTTPAFSAALALLGQTLLAAGQPADAEPVLSESLTIRERAEADLWKTAFTRAMLGAALSGQKKYAEGEPLLLEGYRGLQARADLIPHATLRPLPWCRERLVQLYENWGKPEGVAKWRAEQAKDTPVGPPAPDKVPPKK